MVWQEDSEAGEVTDSRKRNVKLSVGEDWIEEVESYALVRSSLGLVDGLSECRKDGKLLARERDPKALWGREGDSR